jgi:hypothetical protein
MGQIGGNQLLELPCELWQALRHELEPEQFHRNQPVQLWLVRPVDGPQRAGADLMKNTEGSESVRRRRAGSVRVQLGYSSREGELIVTLKGHGFNRLAGIFMAAPCVEPPSLRQ